MSTPVYPSHSHLSLMSSCQCLFFQRPTAVLTYSMSASPTHTTSFSRCPASSHVFLPSLDVLFFSVCFCLTGVPPGVLVSYQVFLFPLVSYSFSLCRCLSTVSYVFLVLFGVLLRSRGPLLSHSILRISYFPWCPTSLSCVFAFPLCPTYFLFNLVSYFSPVRPCLPWMSCFSPGVPSLWCASY